MKGSYADEAAFKTLNAAVLKLEGKSTGNRMFYLALPPSVFAPVTTNIKACCMSSKYVNSVHVVCVVVVCVDVVCVDVVCMDGLIMSGMVGWGSLLEIVPSSICPAL